MVAVDGVADRFAPAAGVEGVDVVDVFVLGDVDGLQESLRHVSYGAGHFGLDVAADDSGDQTAQGGAEIAGGEVVAGEVVGRSLPRLCLARARASFWAWSGQKRGCLSKRGERQRRPSENVNEHKDTRSLALREDIKSLLRVEFWNLNVKEHRQECLCHNRA